MDIRVGSMIRAGRKEYLVVEAVLNVSVNEESIILFDKEENKLVYPSLDSVRYDNELWTGIEIDEVVSRDKVVIKGSC